MDLLAFCTSSQSSSSPTTSSGSIHVMRWVSWQRVFSNTLTNTPAVTSSTSSDAATSNAAQQQQQQHHRVQPTNTLSTLRWSPDGRVVSLQFNRISDKVTIGGGSSELLSIGHQTRFQTTPSFNADYDKLVEALASNRSGSRSALINDGQLSPVQPSPLAWVVATRRFDTIAQEIDLNQEDEENGSRVHHLALTLPSSLSGACDLIRFTHFPEPLPPIEMEVGGVSNITSSSTFLPWDSETVASNLASNTANNSVSLSRRGRQLHASILAYGSSVGSLLRLPQDFTEVNQEDSYKLHSYQATTQGLTLESAAESIAKLTETLSTDNPSVDGSGSSKATQRSGGVRGSCDDPTIVAASPSVPMPVLACLVPPPPLFEPSSSKSSNSTSVSGAISLLAYGTFPLVILQQSGYKRSIESLSLSCDLSSLFDGGLMLTPSTNDVESSYNLSLQLRLHNLFSVSEKSIFLLHISSVYTQVDSCLRSAARSILLMSDEWKVASTSMRSVMMAMEESISKNALDPSELAHLKCTAGTYYPNNPVPLASAELFRLFSLGSSTGSGFSDWLDASIDFSTKTGAGNLAKLMNTVESAMAALETLSVTRVARSIELLVLSISDVLSAATKPLFSSIYRNMGVTVKQLEAFIEEAGNLLVLLQRLRSRALKARSIYSALFVFLRLLRQQHQHTINLSAIADAEAEEIAAQVQAGIDVVSTGPARRERRYRASAAGLAVSTLTARDSKLVREALRPRKIPETSKYDRERSKRKTAQSSSIAYEDSETLLEPTADPLGIFGSIFSPNISSSASSSLFSSSEGTTMSDALENMVEKNKEEEEEDVEEETKDPFLNQSLTDLLGIERETNLLKIFTGTHGIVTEEFPMSAYSVNKFEDEDGSSYESVMSSRLSGQMFALCKRWTRICSSPSKVLSSQCTVSFSASLRIPQLQHLTLQNALASSILRASCFTYQDRGLMVDSENGEVNIDDNTTNRMRDVFKFGFHTCLLSLPPIVVRENLKLPSKAEAVLALAVILRVSLQSSTESPYLEVAVVELPLGSFITASSYYGPLPGSISSHRYESEEAGNGFLPSTSFPSDNDRFFSIVIDGFPVEIVDQDGQSDSMKSESGRGIYLAQLDTRLVTFTKCLVAPDECLTWALKFAARTRLVDCILKCRFISPSISTDLYEMNDEQASVEAFVKSVGKTFLDACGPRGAAVVVVNNKQLSVFDMTEDEGDGEEE